MAAQLERLLAAAMLLLACSGCLGRHTGCRDCPECRATQRLLMHGPEEPEPAPPPPAKFHPVPTSPVFGPRVGGLDAGLIEAQQALPAAK